MDHFNHLPLEIQLDILIRIPAESIRDLELVCKTWKSLFRHPSFSWMHLDRVNHDNSGKLGFLASTKYFNAQEFKYFEYNQSHESTTSIERVRRVNLKAPFYRTSIVGSCNGLICLDGRPSICICNPITREHIMLPEIQFFDTHRCSNWTCGFGYVSTTNEYKVVGIHVSFLVSKIIEVHIYTLGRGDGWRNLGKFIVDFGLDYLKPGVFANGTLYWIGGNLKKIFTFDLAEEKFCEHLSPPPLPLHGNWDFNNIGVLDGFLYFAVWVVDEDNRCFDIWLLEKKNDMKKQDEYEALGWTKKFRLEEDQLVSVTKCGSVLFHMGDYLNIYNPKASTSKMLIDLKEWICEIFPHKNTLVSLKELGEKDTKIMESIEKAESCDPPLEDPEEVEAMDTLVTLKELIMDRRYGDN